METMMPLVPIISRNLRPLRSTSVMPTMVIRKLTMVKSDVAPVRLQIGEAALQQNAGVVADDGVDAGGRVAGKNDAGQQKGDDVFAAQQRIVAPFCRQ